MISLRKIDLNDSKFFLENLLDEKIRDSYKNLPDKITIANVEEQINKIKENCFVIELDGKLIGMRYFWKLGINFFDTGSWITKDFRGKNFGSKAFAEFVNYFQDNAVFRMKPKNLAAENFASKNGFVKNDDGFWYFRKLE